MGVINGTTALDLNEEYYDNKDGIEKTGRSRNPLERHLNRIWE